MRNVLLTGLYWFSRLLGGVSPIRLTPRKVPVKNHVGNRNMTSRDEKYIVTL